MISIPAVKRRCDVHGAVDERRVERDGKGKELKRNIAQRKSEGKRVESPGGQPCQSERGDQQAVTMDQGKERADHGKRRCCKEQNFPRSHQAAQIHGERANEHQPNVVGAVDPRAVVEADTCVALEICKPEREHAPRERDNPRAHDHAKDPEQRAARQVKRRYFRDALSELCRWR